MLDDIICVLSCPISHDYKAEFPGSTFQDLLTAAESKHVVFCKREHKKGCHRNAWIADKYPPDALPARPPPDSHRVSLGDNVAGYLHEGSSLAAWFTPDIKDSTSEYGSDIVDADDGFSSDSSLSDTSPPATLLKTSGSGILQCAYGDTVPGRNKLVAYPFIMDTLLGETGAIWVDKTSDYAVVAQSVNDSWDRGLTLIHRPTGFGKTSFLGLLEFMHDIQTRFIADDALRFTRIGTDFEGWTEPHSEMVLRFDLAFSSSYTEDFSHSFESYIRRVLTGFVCKYQSELKIPDDEFSHVVDVYINDFSAFHNVMRMCQRSGYLVYICIDNYNAPLLSAPPGKYAEIREALECFLIHPLERHLAARSVSAGVLIGTGDRPDLSIRQQDIFSNNPWAWLTVTEATDSQEIQTAFGYTLDEIRELGRVFDIDHLETEVQSVLQPHMFGPDQRTVYSMREVGDLVRSKGKNCPQGSI